MYKFPYKINSLMEELNAVHYKDFTTVMGVLSLVCVVLKTSFYLCKNHCGGQN